METQSSSGDSRKRRRSSSSSSGQQLGAGESSAALPPPKRAARAGESASGFRGVTYHQRSNRFEAHCWHGQRQLYLGGWDDAETAALAADIAAVCLRGEGATLNYHKAHYAAALPELRRCSIESVAAALRSMGRGGSPQSTSVFKGVTRHQKGRWEARIGSSTGRRYTYLGLHATEVAAAQAYDRAAIAQKGAEAATNFHLAEYLDVLSEEQLSQAVQRGLITAADLSTQHQPWAALQLGMQGADTARLAPVEAAAAATCEQALAALPDSPLAAAPLQLPGAGTSSSMCASPAPASTSCTGQLAGLESLFLDCFLQGGTGSPQSVLPMVSLPGGAEEGAAWAMEGLRA